MEDFNIDEFNKLCAEFIGAKNLGKKGYSDYDTYEHELFERTEWSHKYQDNIETSECSVFRMEFNTNWNWIIKVLTEITKTGINWEMIDFNGSVSEPNCFKASIFNLDIGKPYNKIETSSVDPLHAVTQTLWKYLKKNLKHNK